MITNESGIHTFALKLRCKYSEIQNIIEQNECIRTSKGKLGLSPYYQIPQFKYIGVEIQLGQSVSHPCWLILIVNPSSLLAGTYEPTALFQADKESVQQIKHRLRDILDQIGVDRRLKEFKLSRCDLTCNLYYERKADVQNRLNIFKKSFPIPHYNAVKLGKYSNSDEKFKGANKHSWTIENKSKSCAFSVYDKSYELEKRHNIAVDEHILRLELRFGRSKITKLTKTSVYKGYKRDKIEMRGDRAEMSDFPLYLNTVAGGLDCRNQAIGGFSFVVKLYALPVVEIIGQFLYLLGRYGFDAQIGYCF